MAFPFAAAGSLLSAGLGMMSAKKAAKDQKKAQQVALSNAGRYYVRAYSRVYGDGIRPRWRTYPRHSVLQRR
jgi:hypothetical protein